MTRLKISLDLVQGNEFADQIIPLVFIVNFIPTDGLDLPDERHHPRSEFIVFDEDITDIFVRKMKRPFS